jgi:hypothetical protein
MMNPADLPAPEMHQDVLNALLSEPWTFEELKRKAFMDAMHECDDMHAVAIRLGVSLKSTYNLLHRYTGLPCVDKRSAT